MAWVKKRNSAKGVRWTGVYKDGDSERTAGTFVRKGDALLAAEEAERRLRLGDALPKRRQAPRIEDFAQHYLATAGTHGVGVGRRKNVEGYVRKHIVPFFSGKRLDQIGAADVRRFIASLELSPSTVPAVYGTLQRMMAIALEEDLIAKSPCTLTMRKMLPRKRSDEIRAEVILPLATIRALAGAVDPRYRALILTLGYMGLRLGEAMALTVRDVDLKSGRLTIDKSVDEKDGGAVKEPKSRSSIRTLDMPKALTKELAEHIDRFVSLRRASSYLFTARNGSPLRQSSWRRRHFDPALRRIELPDDLEPKDVHPHVLRHTSVSLLIKAGRHPKEIQRWCGHSRFQMTMDVYGHLFPESSSDVAAALDAAIEAEAATR